MNKDIIVYRLGIDIADRYNEESNDSVRTIVNTLLIIIITITTIFLMQNLTILIILIIYFQTKIKLDYGTYKVKNVYSFGKRSILLTEDNAILVGGIDFNLNTIKKFKLIEKFPKQIKSLALGSSHAILLDSNYL